VFVQSVGTNLCPQIHSEINRLELTLVPRLVCDSSSRHKAVSFLKEKRSVVVLETCFDGKCWDDQHSICTGKEKNNSQVMYQQEMQTWVHFKTS